MAVTELAAAGNAKLAAQRIELVRAEVVGAVDIDDAAAVTAARNEVEIGLARDLEIDLETVNEVGRDREIDLAIALGARDAIEIVVTAVTSTRVAARVWLRRGRTRRPIRS